MVALVGMEMSKFAKYAKYSWMKTSHSAFTLAELLIALAILGVIGAFTIPKVMVAQQSGQRNAILKETYSALTYMLSMSAPQGEITSATYIAYFQSHFNAVKVCNNASTDGCWPGAATAPDNTSTAHGFLLHNGAMITDVESAAPADIIWVDWNGTAGPNQNCVDQIPFVLAVASGTYDGSTVQA